MPSVEWPSDHVSLCCDLEWRDPARQGRCYLIPQRLRVEEEDEEEGGARRADFQIIRSVGGGGAHYGRIVDLAHVRATVHRLVWGRVAVASLILEEVLL